MVQDFSQGVNKCLKRCATPIPAPWQVWQRVAPTSTCFFNVDLSASYYQIPLDEESQPLTCFMMPRGRFRMTQLSMGLSASSDAFNHCVGTMMDNFPNLKLTQEIDYLLVFTSGMTELDEQLELLLSICHEHHLTLSPRKFQLLDEYGSLIFAGHRISAKGCKPDPDRMSTISEFLRPEMRKHLQSLFGLIAQFQAWAQYTATAK